MCVSVMGGSARGSCCRACTTNHPLLGWAGRTDFVAAVSSMPDPARGVSRDLPRKLGHGVVVVLQELLHPAMEEKCAMHGAQKRIHKSKQRQKAAQVYVDRGPGGLTQGYLWDRVWVTFLGQNFNKPVFFGLN